MFPAIAMKLLGFVALYGLILMPMGAVIFVDFWLIRKFGLESNYAEKSGKSFNLAAGLAWFVTLGTAWLLVKYAGVQIYFVSLPGWFVAAGIYIGVSHIYQKKIRPEGADRAATPMNKLIAKIVALIALVVLTVMAILFLAGVMELEQVKQTMLVATVFWFIAATLWMWKDNSHGA
jgi:hypothetical protein